MRSEELDRALGATPASFAEKMDQTLCGLKEEKEVKRIALRTVVVFALVTVLLCSTAYALVSKGLEWYYNNRFSAYQENEPDKHQDIMDNLQTDIPQTRTDDPDVSVAVEEVSWAAEHGTLVVSVAATPVDPERYVIYAVDQLDEDGSYMGPDGPVDPDSEERLEHWLWTNDGHGPVEEMIPAGKQLLLFEATRVLCGENNLMGDNYSYDVYTDEEGVCRAVIEYRVEYLAPDYEERIRQKLAAYPDSEAYLLGELDKARQLREMLDASQDGVLTLTIPYRWFLIRIRTIWRCIPAAGRVKSGLTCS